MPKGKPRQKKEIKTKKEMKEKKERKKKREQPAGSYPGWSDTCSEPFFDTDAEVDSETGMIRERKSSVGEDEESYAGSMEEIESKLSEAVDGLTDKGTKYRQSCMSCIQKYFMSKWLTNFLGGFSFVAHFFL